MEIGIDSFASNTGIDGKAITTNSAQVIKELLERMEQADKPRPTLLPGPRRLPVS